MGNAKVKLEELCAHITDGKHGDCQEQANSGFYFLSCKDVVDGKLNYYGARQITEADFQETHRRTKLEPFDILVTNSGTIGRMAVAPQIELTGRTTFQKSVAILKPIPAKIEPRFLYYLLQGESERLIAFAGGTAQKNLLLRDLRAFTVTVPSRATQRRIASILSAYDDLVENNTRRIKILEDMAQMLYREWFVNFRFPGHEKVQMVEADFGPIPEGWSVGRLEDAIVLQRGFDLPTSQRNPGRVPIIAATGLNGTHDVAKVKAPGVVTGRSGSLGTVMVVWEDFWPLNTALWVKEFKHSNPIHAYFTLKAIDLKGFNSGAAVPTLNRNDIHGLPTVLPDKETLDAFNESVVPLFTLKLNLETTNANLRTTRDFLLPKLISGEISVEVAAELVEQIA